MKVLIDYLPEFLRMARALRKKYPSFEKDFSSFLDELEANPFMGISLGEGVRKVRMAIASKGRGKSAGARVLTYVINENRNDMISITLLTIFDKSRMSNVSDEYISSLVAEINRELTAENEDDLV